MHDGVAVESALGSHDLDDKLRTVVERRNGCGILSFDEKNCKEGAQKDEAFHGRTVFCKIRKKIPRQRKPGIFARHGFVGCIQERTDWACILQLHGIPV